MKTAILSKSMPMHETDLQHTEIVPIYVDSSLLQSRELEGIETSGAPDLIYRIENNGR